VPAATVEWASAVFTDSLDAGRKRCTPAEFVLPIDATSGCLDVPPQLAAKRATHPIAAAMTSLVGRHVERHCRDPDIIS